MSGGLVEIKKAKIAVGRVGGNLTLLHVPTDRFLIVYEHGEAIWQWMEQGTVDIVELIRLHARKHQVSDEVAAYEVIVFLDELRAHGFIDFQLPREREVAPLVDAQTTPADLRGEHLLRLIAGKRPFDSNPLQAVATLGQPADSYTLGEMIKDADAATIPSGPAVAPGHSPAWFAIPRPAARLSLEDIQQLTVGPNHQITVRRVVQLRGPSPDLTAQELQTIANLALDQVDPDRRGSVDVLADARADLSVGDLEQVSPNRTAAMIIIIIIVGDIIIIIIVGGGPGPTRGKTRNGCRTHCV